MGAFYAFAEVVN